MRKVKPLGHSPRKLLETTSNSYLHVDQFAMSEKIDGKRMVVRTGPDFAVFNRRGEHVPAPDVVTETFARLEKRYVFDGEFLDNTYHIFDIIAVPSHTVTELPWEQRQLILDALLPRGCARLVPQLRTASEKIPVYDGLYAANGEGVVFSSVAATYSQQHSYFKFKFWVEVDAVVTAKSWHGDGRFKNVDLGMFDGDTFQHVCYLGGKQAEHLDINDVVAVKAQHATPGNRLYHPCRPRVRDDKLPEECGLWQLEAIR